MSTQPENIVLTEISESAYKWLSTLGQKVDKPFIKGEILTHPDYPALTALTDLLDSGNMDYTVRRASIQDNNEFNYPCIVNLNLSNGNNGLYQVDDFPALEAVKDLWNGIILYSSPDSKWNNALNNKMIRKGRKNALAFAGFSSLMILLSIVTYLSSKGNIAYLGWLITSAIGVITGLLLLSQELGLASEIVQKVCGMGNNKKGCESVLSSKHAKGKLGIIGCIETTAEWKEVLQLSSLMDSLYVALNAGNIKEIEKIMSQSYKHLGELQSDYQAFTQSYIPYRDYVIGGYAANKRKLLQNDIRYINQSQSSLDAQAKLYQEDIALSQTTLDKNKELLNDHVISPQEYRELSSRSIGKKLTVPQIQSSYINTSTQKNDKQKELLDLDNQTKTQDALFREAAYNFKSKVDNWKHNYLLIASTSGTLSFISFVQENQLLQSGKPVAYIHPANNNYYLHVLIPQNNFGKVDTGQKVLLKFNAWQWQEYGTVTGKIDYISSIASDSGYVAKIILPNGLVTNRSHKLAYKEGLTAQAEIITKDMRLSQRFYYDMVKQLKKE